MPTAIFLCVVLFLIAFSELSVSVVLYTAVVGLWKRNHQQTGSQLRAFTDLLLDDLFLPAAATFAPWRFYCWDFQLPTLIMLYLLSPFVFCFVGVSLCYQFDIGYRLSAVRCLVVQLSSLIRCCMYDNYSHKLSLWWVAVWCDRYYCGSRRTELVVRTSVD